MEKILRYKRFINKIYYNLFIEFNKNHKIDFNFSSEKRWDLINEIIKKKNLKTYLEIGCDNNLLFNNVKINDKTGVDPVRGGNIRKTSDQFFSLNKKFFDIVFIDGLHEYSQVNKDITNSIKFLNKDGFILLHDCLPKSMDVQAVPRYRHYWTGDVWKSIVKFRHNKNLLIQTVKIDEGISVIQIKDNFEPLNLNIKEFKKLKFEDFVKNYNSYMNIISYNDFLKSI